METAIDISLFTYPLPEERIAKFPSPQREESKLLLYNGDREAIVHTRFFELTDHLPTSSMVVFNNTKVVRARLIFHKTTGARIEIFCLEPHAPSDYERAFAATERASWRCIVGNSKKWKQDTALHIEYDGGVLTATRAQAKTTEQKSEIVDFSWSTHHTFGQLLELLGRTPIPPYLCRESAEIDTLRYQTVYSRYEGSVAAPTAGLHFTDQIVASLPERGFGTAQVTLHVGAGTFLPVKDSDARKHPMHTEFFDITLSELLKIATAIQDNRPVVAVGTTSVRTLESLAVIGERVAIGGDPLLDEPVGQWEPYNSNPEVENPLLLLAHWMQRSGIDHLYSSTRIMIAPGYRFRVVRALVTNFHQPRSTLLLLISALVGPRWKEIYQYALDHDFRFLSYGDSSLLIP